MNIYEDFLLQAMRDARAEALVSKSKSSDDLLKAIYDINQPTMLSN